MYTNELLFDETDDHVRDLLKQQSIDPTLAKRLLSSSTSSSSARGNEWGWHDLVTEDDSISDHDAQSVGSSAHSSHTTTTRTVRSPTAHTASSVAKASPRAKTLPLTDTASRGVGGSGAGTSYSSRTAKAAQPARTVSEPDPHPHPCEVPVPACALSMYILADRYRLDTLAGLAKDHILGHLTYSTCIPILSVVPVDSKCGAVLSEH